VRGHHHAPAAFTPGKDTVPIVQEAGLALEPVWKGVENLVSTGFDPRTFQFVACRYTDNAMPAHITYILITKWRVTGTCRVLRIIPAVWSMSNDDSPTFIFSNVDMYQADTQYGPF
jgi:hypothetical protein